MVRGGGRPGLRVAGTQARAGVTREWPGARAAAPGRPGLPQPIPLVPLVPLSHPGRPQPRPAAVPPQPRPPADPPQTQAGGLKLTAPPPSAGTSGPSPNRPPVPRAAARRDPLPAPPGALTGSDCASAREPRAPESSRFRPEERPAPPTALGAASPSRRPENYISHNPRGYPVRLRGPTSGASGSGVGPRGGSRGLGATKRPGPGLHGAGGESLRRGRWCAEDTGRAEAGEPRPVPWGVQTRKPQADPVRLPWAPPPSVWLSLRGQWTLLPRGLPGAAARAPK